MAEPLGVPPQQHPVRPLHRHRGGRLHPGRGEQPQAVHLAQQRRVHPGGGAGGERHAGGQVGQQVGAPDATSPSSVA
ncbi:hypothetical protein ABTX82_09760 [Streptomyces lavendulae]|uniref:hypothetical protein n=1 Tax=Streptomyces lavendulae TaxID=1914 RepID=UPI00332682BE